MTELTCILCPKGCRLRVDEKNGYAVTGNQCPRGIEYGKTELTRPIRSVSSTVGITGAAHRRCPVKTDGPIPKSLVFAAVQALNGVTLSKRDRGSWKTSAARGEILSPRGICDTRRFQS